MSDVKRWTIQYHVIQGLWTGPKEHSSSEIEVVLASDHDRIVAELKSKVSAYETERFPNVSLLASSEAVRKDETIAAQKRVITDLENKIKLLEANRDSQD